MSCTSKVSKSRAPTAKKAHKDYTSYARIRKPKAKQRRKAIKKQLGYLNRNIGYIEKMLAGGKALPAKFEQ